MTVGRRRRSRSRDIFRAIGHTAYHRGLNNYSSRILSRRSTRAAQLHGITVSIISACSLQGLSVSSLPSKISWHLFTATGEGFRFWAEDIDRHTYIYTYIHMHMCVCLLRN